MSFVERKYEWIKDQTYRQNHKIYKEEFKSKTCINLSFFTFGAASFCLPPVQHNCNLQLVFWSLKAKVENQYLRRRPLITSGVLTLERTMKHKQQRLQKGYSLH